MKKNTSVFDVDGRPSVGTAMPLAIQHVLAMIIGNITPCIVVANLNLAGTGPLNQADSTLLIQSGLFIAGLATLLQLYPVWKFGARLPMIMGISFAYIPTLISVGTTCGIGALFGAQLIGGLTAVLVGLFIKPLRKYFPPIVAGTVVLTIGLSLYTTAINYVGGGNPSKGNLDLIAEIKMEIDRDTISDELKNKIMANSFISDDLKNTVSKNQNMTPEIKDELEKSISFLQKTSFGSKENWIIAAVTLLVVIACNQFAKGYLKIANILIGILAGYIVALFMGMVDFSSVRSAHWVALPKFLPFGMEFKAPAIISMIIIYIVNSIQAVGDFSATTMGGLNREVSDEELSGGIMGSGISSAISSFFGGLPIATYSQNVGIVSTTKVVSRFVLALSAGLIILAGFIPKFGGLMITIPQAVLGGATITVFGSITMTGIKLIIEDEMSLRNTTIVGLAVAIGMGISLVPEALAQFPSWVNIIFGSSAVTISTIIAFILNIVLPHRSLADEQKERDEMEKELR